MGQVIGYARVSSVGQDYEAQVQRLQEAGATKLFAEKRSGLDSERPELQRCLEYLREGDTLIITKLDRLARSTAHLHQIVEGLNAKSVGFRVLDDPTLDTTTRTGKLVFGILASIAEFETALRKERQMEGIAKAKAEGRVGGRPKLVTDEVAERIQRLRTAGCPLGKLQLKWASRKPQCRSRWRGRRSQGYVVLNSVPRGRCIDATVLTMLKCGRELTGGGRRFDGRTHIEDFRSTLRPKPIPTRPPFPWASYCPYLPLCDGTR